MTVALFRKKPINVPAVQWAGDNHTDMDTFTGGQFLTAHHSDGYTAKVYDHLHDSWIPLRTGDWVLRGPRGEFYPCEQSVFADTYEPVTSDD